MEDNRYTVVLRYDPQNTEIHQKVVARLARLDPNAAKKFKRAAFNGRLILKRNADPATAGRLKQLFGVTGAVCEVLAESEISGPGTADEVRTIQSPMIQCPNCGFEQPAHPECRSCGIIFAKAGRSRPHRAAECPAAPPPQDPPPDGY